ALRALRRNWNYTVINVVGLTFGLACCLVLFLAIRYELSYDRHHAQADRTHRLITFYKKSESDSRNVGVPLPTLAALRTDFPELKHQVTMVYNLYGALVRVSDAKASKFKEPESAVAFVEPDYFRLFDYGWKAGNPKTAVNNPNTVVLSERMARKYFGSSNPVGRTIRIENKMDFVVTGLVENPPVTSSLPFEVLLSFASLRQYGANGGWDDWNSNYSGAQIYLTLPETITPAQVERQLVAFSTKHLEPEQAKNMQYELQPLTSIHFDSRTENSANRTVSKRMIGGMALIGLFVLIAACVNFINLATAQAIRRAKEVGVRKALGSSRAQLLRQFLGETGVLTGLAVGLSFLVASLSLPYVAGLLDIDAAALMLSDPTVIGFVLGLALLTTVLAGFYPAMVLSGYQPVLALRGKIRSVGSGQLTLRRSLIVFQFAISQILLIGTIIAYAQMQHLRTAELGYDKEAVLTFPIPEHKPEQLEALRAKLSGLPSLQSMSFAMSIPSSDGNWWTAFRYENAPKEAEFGVVMRPADTSYFSTYGLKLVAGRMYLPADTMREFVVNESFVRELGLRDPQQVLGKHLSLFGGAPKQIVGVVRDFNTFSLHQKTNPCLITSNRDSYNSLGIKLSTQHGGTAALSRLLSEVEKSWNESFPDYVFSYEFLDQKLANFYQSEERMYALFRLLAGIALFIGCLGLYGVVAFMAESRTKEVGIRKVLGATTAHIVGL
ncbi:MAG: ABC transporter permease, partial [Sphingobacteriaceae bacterium]|nr:ABC transporter permease [Cytophagaceae bacterium]